ncbi:MAG: FAD-dependent oxidoreductase, partial [Thermoprotei archaeon]|nr:FAD-dependent oxidoreductase [Thermoprotei archaeon]
MEPREYDVAVIGAGVIGLFIAYELSKFNVSIVVIEKEAEPGFGVSKGHAGVIHVVQPPFNSLKSVLAVYGNKLYDKVAGELGVSIVRLPALLVARSRTQLALLPIVYALLKLVYGFRGFNVSLVRNGRLRELEPNVEGYGAVMVEGYGVIDSFELIYRLYDTCRARGVEFMFEAEARNIRVEGEHIVIETSRGPVKAKYAVNSAGLNSDILASKTGASETIEPSLGVMLVFDKLQAKSIVAPLPSLKPARTKGGGIIPTVWGNTIWGPSFAPTTSRESREVRAEDVVEVVRRFKGLVKVKGRIIKAYAGVRPSTPRGDFSISYSPITSRVINLVGIESPGLTAAPAIALIVLQMLKAAGLGLRRARGVPGAPRALSTRAMLAQDPSKATGYDGVIVCQCMKVSLADVIEAVRSGASTLDGIIFRTKLGMGSCQGQHCLGRAVVSVLRLTGQSPGSLTKSGGGSWLVEE